MGRLKKRPTKKKADYLKPTKVYNIVCECGAILSFKIRVVWEDIIIMGGCGQVLGINIIVGRFEFITIGLRRKSSYMRGGTNWLWERLLVKLSRCCSAIERSIDQRVNLFLR